MHTLIKKLLQTKIPYTIITFIAYFPYTSTYSSTRHIQTENTTSRIQTYNILQYSNAKTTICNNGRYTANIPTYPTQSLTYIKTNMRHIHTYIVSRHLATRGNNKILRTPPPHITAMKRYFPASLVAPLPNAEQINHPSQIKHTHKVEVKSHPSPLCTLCNTHIHNTHYFNCTTLLPMDLWTDPAGVTALLLKKLVCGPQAGRLDSLTSKCNGSG